MNIAEKETLITMFMDGLQDKGHKIPETISNIPDFPYLDFKVMSDDILSGKMLIQRFGYNCNVTIFDLFSTPFDRFMNWCFIAMYTLVPLIFIIMSVVYSWWFLFGVLSIYFGMSKSKKLYNKVIFRWAIQSETIFCFLYFTGQICLTTTDYNHSYYWKQ